MNPNWLEEVQVEYDMQGARAKLIRHNENLTYQIDDTYLLRIHTHAQGFSTDPIYDGVERVEIHKQELLFLSYLKAQGMNVQVPISNKNGDLVTLLTDGILATMMTWIPGHTIDKSELSTELCYQMGEMTAKLHKASRNFQQFRGLKYDEVLCERLKSKVVQQVNVGHLDTNSAKIMERALYAIAIMLKETKEEAILVHSDLSLSNMLITEAGLVPIDFSLFGYCHPMMDIASLYCNVNGIENRSAIAAGYQSLGDTIDFPALDCCFALNVLLGVILHCESWTKQVWFLDRLQRWCRETFGPIGEGKALISPEFHMINAK